MEQKEPQTVKPFNTVLQEIAKGVFHDRLSDQLQELTAAVVETGKKGSLVITLTVAPIKADNTSNLVASGQSVLKAPAGEPATSVFFHDASGNLVREDPAQLKLPLRVARESA